ncbi:hypothetical protein AB0K74_08325 [Streptomyces sp. NPDC056159]|uniref:hypothetical protein n=1 Tax=unclassified Streptomyces TaxID=2593676 RepID=UPI00341E1C23
MTAAAIVGMTARARKPRRAGHWRSSLWQTELSRWKGASSGPLQRGSAAESQEEASGPYEESIRTARTPHITITISTQPIDHFRRRPILAGRHLV